MMRYYLVTSVDRVALILRHLLVDGCASGFALWPCQTTDASSLGPGMA